MKRIVRLVLAAGLALGAASNAFAQGTPDDGKSAGGGDCAKNAYNCIVTPNPLPKNDTVWMEDMTWMDVRDAMKEGKTTVIIATGGIEPNGPWIKLGKHNWILTKNCEALARKMGNALCAPIVKFSREMSIEPRVGHMLSPGTISLEESTYAALLTDIARSYKANGFKQIFFISDSGGNEKGMAAAAAKVNGGGVLAAWIPEYYDYASVHAMLVEKGYAKKGSQGSDALHDDFAISTELLAAEPKSINFAERQKIGKATIDGHTLDKAKADAINKEIVELRVAKTMDGIKKAIAAGGTVMPKAK
jgi:creatinine amidohydrolase/Fe(II)-dependent formamide hydrolase-like protein